MCFRKVNVSLKLSFCRYPFFGSQIHPEQIYYEYDDYDDDRGRCHSFRCLEITQYFAKFFVQCCRRNKYRCSKAEALPYLIYNFPIEFTAPYTSRQQCYLFKKNVDYPRKKYESTDDLWITILVHCKRN